MFLWISAIAIAAPEIVDVRVFVNEDVTIERSVPFSSGVTAFEENGVNVQFEMERVLVEGELGIVATGGAVSADHILEFELFVENEGWAAGSKESTDSSLRLELVPHLNTALPVSLETASVLIRISGETVFEEEVALEGSDTEFQATTGRYRVEIVAIKVPRTHPERPDSVRFEVDLYEQRFGREVLVSSPKVQMLVGTPATIRQSAEGQDRTEYELQLLVESHGSASD